MLLFDFYTFCSSSSPAITQRRRGTFIFRKGFYIMNVAYKIKTEITSITTAR